MTGYPSDQMRAVVLSALLVVSVVGATAVFPEPAAAQTFGSGSVSPNTVDEQTTNEHTVTLTVNDVNTNDSAGQTVFLDFPDALDLSSSGVTNFQSGSGNVTLGSVNVDQTTNVVAVQFTDDNGTANDTLNPTFDVTNVATPSVTSDTQGNVTAAFNGDDTGPNDFSGELVETLTIEAVGGAGNQTRALNADGTGEFDTVDGQGFIFPDAIVYQGEDDVEFGGTLRGSLTGVSGNAEGQVLSPPIPRDQTVGVYSNTGEPDAPSVTVDQPRITTFDVENENGEDIAGGSVGKSNAELTVVGDYNYNEAEDLEITVTDDTGLEVTDDVVTSATTQNSAGEVTYDLDLTEQSAGTYTIELAGSGNLDAGSAVSTTTVEITAQDNIGIRTGSDTVTQGDDLRYEVTGSIAGNLHLVQIEANDFRDGQSADNYASVFRNVGDVEERGVRVGDNLHERGAEVPSGLDTDQIDAAYAVVEVDDGTGLGVGSVETQYLDTVSVTADVSDRLPSNSVLVQDLGDSAGGPEPVPTFNQTVQESADDVDFDVEEGDITLDSPGQTYVVGSEVDVNGTAPTGMNDVAIYARDEGDFELVEIDGERDIPIDADGTFEETDVALSRGGLDGNEIISLPGSYRIGVIDAADADQDNTGGPDDTLTTQEFNQGTSTQRSLRVIGQSLDAEFPSLINGQIAEQDGDVTINGSAPGADEVLFIAVGPRGQVESQSVTVDSDQTFEEEDIPVGLSRGAISLHVLSIGRDGRVGDGDVPNNGNDLGGFEGYLSDLDSDSLTGDQVRSSILSETVEDTASDDQIVNQNSRIADAQSNIVNVYQEGSQQSGLNPVAAGEVMVVEGTTNLQPDDNTITIELSSEDVSVGLAATDEWGQDGQWTVTVNTTDAATGTYTLEADDGENTVTEEVELVEQVSTPTPTPTEVDDTPTETDTPTATATEEPGTSTPARETETASPTPTQGGGPGFGAVVALVALLAAALLATRRD